MLPRPPPASLHAQSVTGPVVRLRCSLLVHPPLPRPVATPRPALLCLPLPLAWPGEPLTRLCFYSKPLSTWQSESFFKNHSDCAHHLSIQTSLGTGTSKILDLTLHSLAPNGFSSCLEHHKLSGSCDSQTLFHLPRTLLYAPWHTTPLATSSSLSISSWLKCHFSWAAQQGALLDLPTAPCTSPTILNALTL